MKHIILAALEALRSFCEVKVNEALWPNGPTGGAYWLGMTRRNTDGSGRGSYVEEVHTTQDIVRLINDMGEISEFTPLAGAMPNCKYYRGVLPLGYNAVCAAISLDEALELALDICVRNGSHGLELFAKSPVVIGSAMVVFIIEDGMLSTWHPGPVLTPLPKDAVPMTADAWNGEWAVKLEA